MNEKRETRNMNKLKIQNSKFQVRKLPGYTLIEFLIVISILSLSVGSILLFLTSTLKGANQANVTAEVKQNGQSVLDNLQSQIRSSSSVQSVNTGYINAITIGRTDYAAQSGIWLTLSSGDKLTVVCFNSGSDGTENGWIGVAKKPGASDTPDTVFDDYQTLTNKNSLSGVDIVCTATSFQVNTNDNLVIINFIANQGKQAPSRVDYQANVKFQTTIGLRLYQ